MKRYLLLFVALFALAGAFAQESTPLSCTLNPQKPVIVPMIFKGPASSQTQTVPVELEVTYQPEEKLINVKMTPKYDKPLVKKEQYTHLWFPMSFEGKRFKDLSLEEHFKRHFRSKVFLEDPIKTQSNNMLYPSFDCQHGLLMNQKETDLMLSLKNNKAIVLKIKIVQEPVVLKIRNVVPLRARFEFPQLFNKSNLQYISNNFTITFRTKSGTVGDGVVTADSLLRMIDELDSLINETSIARNRHEGERCKALKAKASKFDAVKIDESLYEDSPEMRRLIKRFQDRKTMLDDIKCGDFPPPPPCSVDKDKIARATRTINDLLNDYRLNNVNNRQRFDATTREIDSYLSGISDKCKNNSKYKTVIKQYQDAKRAYLNAVR